MNTQEYISSGIVETYVLGLASPEERAEFERMCDAHAEVKAARDSFELQLEQYSLANATEPPKNLRSQILSEIEIQKDKSGFNSHSYNSSNEGAVSEAPVIRSTNWIRYLAAASVVLLVGSIALNLYYYNKYQEVNTSYESLVQQQTEMANRYKKTEVEFNEYKAAMQKLNDPAMAVIRMTGGEVPTSPDPASLATVYWDTRTKDVFLKVNNMPQPANDLQYQLWAIVDGVPVDAGVFNMDANSLFVTMKNIPKAQAFAITLEKKGGSPTPQGKMYVLGKV